MCEQPDLPATDPIPHGLHDTVITFVLDSTSFRS